MSDLLLPFVDDDGAPFWKGTAAGELRMQRCQGCSRFRFPPRPMCPWCRSEDSEWPAMSGQGTVWSYVVAHPPLLPAYAALAPYNVIVVALADDPLLRIIGNLVARPDGEINEIDPSTIEIGMPVKAVFPAPVEGFVLPRWMAAS